MLYEQIRQNKRKTTKLMLIFSLVTLIAGWAFGYIIFEDLYIGLILSVIILIFYIPITYISANSQVLKMSGAKEASREEYPQLYDIVEELIIPARLPMPKIYVVHDPSPNAFATGVKPEKASIAFTTGLLEVLNREELEAVASHELAHIRNFDIRLMTICIALVSIIILLAELGTRMMFFSGRRSSDSNNQKKNPILMIIAIVLIILAPLIAQIVRLSVSRNREYLADATAVEFTRNPVGLISALEKISQDKRDLKHAKEATAPMYIVTPLNKKKEQKLWATHPPIKQRINRLKNM